VIGDIFLPIVFIKVVKDNNLVKIKKGNKEGNTLVAQINIPLKNELIAMLGKTINININKRIENIKIFL
jgi:hypothetical protein